MLYREGLGSEQDIEKPAVMKRIAGKVKEVGSVPGVA